MYVSQYSQKSPKQGVLGGVKYVSGSKITEYCHINIIQFDEINTNEHDLLHMVCMKVHEFANKVDFGS